MDYVHRCFFCGWHRAAASPTVVNPRCEKCGCALSSVAAIDFQPAEVLLGQEGGLAPALRLLAVLGAVLMAIAAARAGYGEGGPAIAVIAAGVWGLFSVSLLPDSR